MSTFKITFPMLTLLCSGLVYADLAAKPLSTEEARPHFDKTYMDFAKIWMKEDALRKAGNLLSFRFGSRSDIIRTFYDPYRKIEQPAIETFKAYCDHNQGTYTKLKSEVFCVKDNTPLGHMLWREERKDKGGKLDEITFVHEVGQLANESLKSQLDIQPGADINTKYGRGLVVEVKPGGLIYFQPQKGQAKWISTDDVLKEWESRDRLNF
ncbi:hypothetical protein [Neisseria sp. Ec49-e6-T10]|uniref:hypothetical protein n=1 Tax=Neisseria sp. Ec49-e6-T10 TaxID=3140744 RepID=UPI003EC0F8F1